MIEIEYGQIWKVKANPRISMFRKDDLVIILSLDNGYWTVGNFWYVDLKDKSVGGARQIKLDDDELKDNCVYIGHILDIFKDK